jgi:hypothetical protein
MLYTVQCEWPPPLVTFVVMVALAAFVVVTVVIAPTSLSSRRLSVLSLSQSLSLWVRDASIDRPG